MRRAYLQAMARLRRRNEAGNVERLIGEGRWEEAIAGLDEAAEEVSAEFRAAFLVVVKVLADAVRDVAPNGFAFDVTHWRVQDLFRRMESNLVTMFRRDARAATLDAVTRRQPGDVSWALGLGTDQAAHVRRFRAGLGTSDRERSRRTARELPPRAAISPGTQIAMINQLVTQLRLAQANRVGLWLGQLAVQQAADITLRMAVEFGAIRQARRTWHTRRDPLVRDSHSPMDGQERDLGVPFTSGANVNLMFPGDPRAPAKETRECRCGLTVSFS